MTTARWKCLSTQYLYTLYSLDVRDFDLSWSPILIPLFRHVVGSDELICDHVTYSRISPTLLLLRRSLSDQSSSFFLLVTLIAFVLLRLRPYFSCLFIYVMLTECARSVKNNLSCFCTLCGGYVTSRFSYWYFNSSLNQTRFEHCKWNPMFVTVLPVLITRNIETLGHILSCQLNGTYIALIAENHPGLLQRDIALWRYQRLIDFMIFCFTCIRKPAKILWNIRFSNIITRSISPLNMSAFWS